MKASLPIWYVVVHYADGLAVNLAGFRCRSALGALRYVGAGFTGLDLGHYSFLSVSA